MHSVFARNNAIVAYTLSVSACLTFCCFLSTVFIDYRANANLNTVKVAVIHLTPLFNWNVKQLFLYLTAEYQTRNNDFNQVVLWDKIVLRGDNAVLDFKNMNTKYYFWDDGNGLRGNKNVTLTLSWNIIPNAGLLPSVNALGSHTFAFPSEYTSLRV
ncbi:PREDICTED: signal peptidase complex subunit 3 [Habropoda laboriosa]|uniref:signal peptidase complex subunit 3 n=1 Tax=Habropoda laboriosa TaxID=597456 RepID=UPI00083D2C36|nr:PREDICTED: signal peptidase complex subunit 3 [Habropoda laboriosa]